MSTMTDSFRLADMSAAMLLRQTTHTAKTATLPSRNADVLDAAAELAAPAIEWLLDWPGREQLARLTRALKRPAHATRTAAQELSEERLNTITHGLGLAISAVA